MTASSLPRLIVKLPFQSQDIRVWQQDAIRYLDFADGLMQSAIDVNQPGHLPLVLNRAMLAGVMFTSQIKTVCLAGTGGGATARFLAHRQPHIQGDAVEHNAAVVAIAKQYFDFPVCWSLHTSSIQYFLQATDKRYDLMIVDIAEQQLTPAGLLSEEFLLLCRQRLSLKGHLALNLLIKDANGFIAALKTIRKVFERRTLCLSLQDHRNIVVLAFNQLPEDLPPLTSTQIALCEQKWSIECVTFYAQMRNDNPIGSGIF